MINRDVVLKRVLLFFLFLLVLPFYSMAADLNTTVAAARDYIKGNTSGAGILLAWDGNINEVISQLRPSEWSNADVAGTYVDERYFDIPEYAERWPDQPINYYIPTTYIDDSPSPMLVYLHGGGNTTENDHALVYLHTRLNSASLSPNIENGDAIVVVPLAPINLDSYARWNLEESDDFIEAIIVQMNKWFNVDLNEVHLAGTSMGGIGAYHLGQRMVDRFATISATAGNFEGSFFSAMKGSHVFLFHGEDDGYLYDVSQCVDVRDPHFSCTGPQTGIPCRDTYTDATKTEVADYWLKLYGVDVTTVISAGGPHNVFDPLSITGLGQWTAWMYDNKVRDPYPKTVVAATPKSSFHYLTPVEASPHTYWLSINKTGTKSHSINAWKVVDTVDPSFNSCDSPSTEVFDTWSAEPVTKVFPDDYPEQSYPNPNNEYPAFIDGSISGNTITLRTDNVEEFSVWLDDHLVADINQPITINVDGLERIITAHPNLLDTVRSYLRRKDWEELYTYEVVFKKTTPSVTVGSTATRIGGHPIVLPLQF